MTGTIRWHMLIQAPKESELLFDAVGLQIEEIEVAVNLTGFQRIGNLWRYSLAGLIFALALGLRFAALPVEAGLAFITFYPAVFLAYYFLGFGPGVLVMMLSTVVGHYIFQPPFWSFDFTFNGAVVTATFIVSNSLVGWLTLRHIEALEEMKGHSAAQNALQMQLEIALNDAKDLYAKAPVGYYSLDQEGRLIQANDKLLGWLEASEQEALGTPIANFFDAAGQAQFRKQYPIFMRDGFIEGLEFELFGKKGKARRVSVTATAVFREDGTLLRSRSVMFDITELDTAKRHVQSQHRLLAGVVEGLPFGVALFDDKQILQSYNKKFTAMLALEDGVLERPEFSFYDLIRYFGERGDYGNQPWEAVYDRLSALMKQKMGTQFERQSQDGKWLSIHGIVVFDGWTLLTYSDITESKRATLALEEAQVVALKAIADQKVANEEAQYIAFHDPLTGLANRRLFADRAEQAVAVATRQGVKLAICYLDLDGFKKVNDTHGHEAGDKLLIAVANRLSECVRAQDTVCRLGGDEFVLMLTHFDHETEVVAVLNRILVEVAKPVSIDSDISVSVSASIGYSLFPEDAQYRDLLMRHADRAMYDAKKRGKNCILRYHQEV